jgi:hypothetical protein
MTEDFVKCDCGEEVYPLSDAKIEGDLYQCINCYKFPAIEIDDKLVNVREIYNVNKQKEKIHKWICIDEELSIINVENPFEEKYAEKIILLIKQFAYPWEYEAIKAGDKYFDGEDTAFEVLEKTSGDLKSIFSPQKSVGSSIIGMTVSEPRQTIAVKAKVKVKEVGGQYIFGEEQKLFIGKTFNILTSSFAFNDFVITGIE